nr:alpha amylase N-terminal ig-like domain-containing protein [Shigella boydii]
MITVSSLKHSAKSEDSYAYDNETLYVRLRTLRGEVDKVILWIGDPYNWAEGGLLDWPPESPDNQYHLNK